MRLEPTGLDRYDNEIGYEETNVVSCCFDCNSAKRTMHGDDYLRQRQEFIDEIEINAKATGRL